jgi:hypothetical protein
MTPYYIDANGEIFGFDDTDPADAVAKIIAERGLVPATPEQVQAIQNPVPTPEQLTAAARTKRNGLLAASDWTQLPDVQAGMAAPVRQAWTAYRAALRDITEQTGFPQTMDWPELPIAQAPTQTAAPAP